jgi:uroporphyrinogen-III synthase
MRPLVILRPQPAANATADAARTLGLEPLVMPLFGIKPVDWVPPPAGDFDAVLLTSANAVRDGGDRLQGYRQLPVHCVGEVTAAAARGAGFAVATVGTAGIEHLLQSLPAGLRLLHLCGAHRRVADSAHEITVVETYRAVELQPPDGLAAIDGPVVALHSPRAAWRFAQAVEQAGIHRSAIALVAISEAAAAAAGSGWETVEAASSPTDSALLAIAARLCNKPA